MHNHVCHCIFIRRISDFKSELFFTFNVLPVNLTNHIATEITSFFFCTVVLFVTAYIKINISSMHKIFSDGGLFD